MIHEGSNLISNEWIHLSWDDYDVGPCIKEYLRLISEDYMTIDIDSKKFNLPLIKMVMRYLLALFIFLWSWA